MGRTQNKPPVERPAQKSQTGSPRPSVPSAPKLSLTWLIAAGLLTVGWIGCLVFLILYG